MRILVAIPCYNCEKQIVRVLKGFPAELLARVAQVLVIDNQSTDATLDAAARAIQGLPDKSKFRVIQNCENYGLGGSHKQAFLYGEKQGFDYVAILHGDDQATTAELARLISEAEKDPGLAAVLGSRFMRGSRTPGYSLLRIAGNVGLNWVYSVLTGRSTFDLGAGLNLFRMKDLADHRYLGFRDQFTFNNDLLLDYYRKRSALKFVPITWSETDQQSNAKTFSVGWTSLKTVLKWVTTDSVRTDRGPEFYRYSERPL